MKQFSGYNSTLSRRYLFGGVFFFVYRFFPFVICLFGICFFLLCIAIIPIEIVNLQSRCIKCGSFIMPKQIAGIAATDTNNFNIQCACNRTPPKRNNLQLNFECYVRLYSFSNSLNLSAFVVVVGFRVLWICFCLIRLDRFFCISFTRSVYVQRTSHEHQVRDQSYQHFVQSTLIVVIALNDVQAIPSWFRYAIY